MHDRKDASVEFGTARASDVAEIRALVRDAYRRYVVRIGREPAPMTADYARLVAEERVVLARLDGQLAGVLVWSVQPDHLLVENVAVAPARQGSGIGSALLARADDIARSHDRHELRLYTHATMTENIAFYPRHGYRDVGHRIDDGFDRVHFVRRLDEVRDSG